MKLPHKPAILSKINRDTFNPKKLAMACKHGASSVVETAKYLGSFSLLLTIYLSARAFRFLGRVPFIPARVKESAAVPLKKIYQKVVAASRRSEKTVNRLNLIELAVRNMGYKKSRSIITIGGMAVGVAAIVFLVSVGFGLQELVIGRVARLDELRQADVAVQTGSKLHINDETMNSISEIPGVEDVQPVIAVVGRVSLNESIFDVAVFGVTSDYLQSSAIKPVKGRIFESNDLTVKIPTEDGRVAGESIERVYAQYGSKIQDVDFAIDQDEWIAVREGHRNRSRIIGYTRREPGTQIGEEYWGDSYESDDGVGSAAYTEDLDELGKWVKSTFQLWSKQICLVSENPDCVENNYVVMRENDEDPESSQIEAIGYIVEKHISLRGTYNLDNVEEVGEDDILGGVLGESTEASDSAEVSDSADTEATATTSDDDEASASATGSTAINSDVLKDLNLDASSAALLEIEGLIATGSAGTENVKKIDLDKRAVKEAIVNRAMLSLLGLKESEAIGKTFTTSFVVVGSLAEGDEKIQSEVAEYTIVGVDPENVTPFFYVPFIDVRTLGVANYSQLKVVAEKEDALADVRNQISVLGYSTSSVVDTVERINVFFESVRVVLALVGGVALAVASLGMFNTLTVSLLERTREVGLMKAMGMRSYEVRELFLTESMIMGFLGGFLGITIGIAGGKLISIALSAFAITQGEGIINVSTTPPLFIILTMLFSLLVGLITGIFPARRATKISALDALRYE